MADAARISRIASAVGELAKGMKSVSFYPPGHPSLIQAIARIVQVLEDLPLPESGIEIEVTRNALLNDGVPLPVGNKALSDLNRELFLRRASKIIILPNLDPDEVVAFLGVVNKDVREIQDEGGIEKVLLERKVSRIWANRVDYEGLTEMLKKAEERTEEERLEEMKEADLSFTAAEGTPLEDVTLEALLSLIERESDPAAYREHIVNLSRMLLGEPPDRRIEYATRSLSIFATHMAEPPYGNDEIARLAQVGIREITTDDMIAVCIGRLRDRSGRERAELEKILAAIGERAIRPLLDALSGEEDLIVRKAIVDIVIRIGRPAAAAILDRLSDDRWYIVRNLITILGNLGLPDLAPAVATTLSHPDLRVKKEAIKALSKLPHPAAITALGDLCFHADETVALTATAALSAKREPEAVLVLYQRASRRKVCFPHYRLAHEAIDSLRAIGTDDAVSAIENIIHMKVIWDTKKVQDMKIHALRSISRMPADRVRQIVENARSGSEKYLRWEAERILRKMGAAPAEETGGPPVQA